MQKLSLVLIGIGLIGCNDPSSLTGTSLTTSTTPPTTTSSPNSVSVQPTKPTSFTHFVYVANKGDDTITQFGLDTATGNLWDIGADNRITTHSQPIILFTDSAKKYLFCINANSTYLDIYSINSTTGLLTLASSKNMGETVKGFTWPDSTHLILQAFSSVDGGLAYTLDSTTGTITFTNNNYNSLHYFYNGGSSTYSGKYTYYLQGTDTIELYKETLTNGMTTWTDTGTGFTTGNTPSSLLIF